MLDVKNLIKQINYLYDYGEIEYNNNLSYLEDLDLIKNKEGIYIITKKWINFSGKVTKEDFTSSLECSYPPLLDYLLWKVYHEAYAIGQSGDGKVLYEFIDSIPKFADRILEVRKQELVETEEIKLFYRPIFNGYPEYRTILTRLKFIQLAEEIDDKEVEKMGKTPNEIWIKERKISSNIKLELLKDKNLYTLTPYIYNDFEVSEDIKEILSHPWKIFMIILGMVISEYKAEGLNVISIRPKDKNNPYSEQTLETYIYNQKGKENRVGDLKGFIKQFCNKNYLYLFPDKSPDVDAVLFNLIDAKQFNYKDGEYILNQSFDDRLYSSEGIIIKNRSRRFKMLLKDYIEELRETL